MKNGTKVACITGGAKRIGRSIVTAFHQMGYQVVIHYHHSEQAASDLAKSLNQIRPNSAKIIQANLENFDEIWQLADKILTAFGRIDVLVHNASRFYPTPFGTICPKDWQNLMLSNAKAPLFLSQALAKNLQQNHGCIISILDIHANARPFVGYSVYNMAKSAHQMLVQSLALELAPFVRVNGVAPGVNILPDENSEQSLTKQQITSICQSIPLQRVGEPSDIADAVLFLAQARYITGQVLAVDGGRSLTLAGNPMQHV
ncbi:pteridine reductase [Moraxella macacae 0408225]|uniref:Pteridine reductase n=1 Tax=Moraxella macacae 0408225 TaxID=1230338 RepID=L2F8L4_9GAMM|nr:pteridine reductase [Moraxella macacae]ELA08813.1 pteridine reductase [Moraxella macacae 0408225]